MEIYPPWLEFVRYLGLDPITVWIEYQTVFFICLGLSVLLLIFLLYCVFRGLKLLLANFYISNGNRFAFFKTLDEVDAQWQADVAASLGGDRFIYAMPAAILEDVPGFRKVPGLLVLAETKLIYVGKTEKARGEKAKGRQPIASYQFPLNSFKDANIKDGVRGLELKLVFPESRPVFKLLGINRDLGQELFMRMHALRLAIKEQRA